MIFIGKFSSKCSQPLLETIVVSLQLVYLLAVGKTTQIFLVLIPTFYAEFLLNVWNLTITNHRNVNTTSCINRRFFWGGGGMGGGDWYLKIFKS